MLERRNTYRLVCSVCPGGTRAPSVSDGMYRAIRGAGGYPAPRRTGLHGWVGGKQERFFKRAVSAVRNMFSKAMALHLSEGVV